MFKEHAEVGGRERERKGEREQTCVHVDGYLVGECLKSMPRCVCVCVCARARKCVCV
jgi:hypothetical protein